MLRTLRSLSLVLAVALLAAPAAANAAPATKKASAAKSKKASSKKSTKKTSTKVTYPTVSKVSPLRTAIGAKLTIRGKGYKSGLAKNFIVFRRDGGRALFVKADKATSTSITVTIPAKLLTFFTQKGGSPAPTRFRLRVMATRLAKSYTKNSQSPLIDPSVSAGAGGGAATAASADCDNDGVPNSKDTDDDNDLVPDTEEALAGTDPCKADTDGDGMTDGWEIQSAKDRNGGVYPKARPVPNPLDKEDANVDSDGDGLTNLEEYTAWATFGNHAFPLNYSGGNTASAGRNPVTAATKQFDRDGNGFLSDFERDADNDGISNMDEMRTGVNMARIVTSQSDNTPDFYDFGVFTTMYIDKAAEASANARCGGINQVPFYCVDKAQPDHVNVQKVDTLDWLTADTDGDGIPDGADDVDHDGLSNAAELKQMRETIFSDRKFAPIDACVPNIDNAACLLSTVDIDGDGLDNAHDLDDDGDGLLDVDEVQTFHTSPLLVDTDGDGVSDTFEVFSAKDLNSTNLPYPTHVAYPNPLDGTDANLDFDRDGLTMLDEDEAWMYGQCGTITSTTCSPHLPLTYSDGKQMTDPSSGVKDGERDVDGDSLTNWEEAHGPLSGPDWWDKVINSEEVKCTGTYKESTYPGPAYKGTSFVNWDTDGDGLDDGNDDIDHDGYSNLEERTRPGLDDGSKAWCTLYVSTAHPGAGLPPYSASAMPTARMQPFNPCKPTYSGACDAHPPVGYYPPEEDWRSPVSANGTTSPQ